MTRSSVTGREVKQNYVQWLLFVTFLKGLGIFGCQIRDVAKFNFEIDEGLLAFKWSAFE